MGVRWLRSRALGFAAGAMLVVLGAVPAQAADQTDQSQPFFTGSQAFATPMAQTFTAGGSGAVDRVSLMVSSSTGATSISVQLQSTTGGKPSGTVLGTSTFNGSVPCCHQWHDFTFNPAVSVTGGTQYAIVVRPTGRLTWYVNFGHDDYSGGQLWLSSGSSWVGGASFGYDFCFQTFLTAGATNHPPAVTVNSPTVTAPEGSAITNSGTFSDPDNDPVALKASLGTVSKSGAGTWTWSTPPQDEAAAQTVTITADDGQGATATVSFTFTVTAVPPIVTLGGSGSSVPEGTAVSLTGSAASASAADTSAGFTYSWTVTKDGNAFASGTGATVSFTPDDEGTFVATLQATDDGNATGSATVTMTGLNVAPTAVISGATHDTLVLVAGQPVTFTGGFTDPGKLDTHTSTLDWGDQTPVDTYAFAAGVETDVTDTHSFGAAGTYTITYSVADDDGGASSLTTKVTVESPAQALSVIDSYVGGMASLNGGEKNGLSAKLEAAMASAARGDTNATCNQLDAFMNDLSALTGNGRLSATDSATLSSSVWAVHRALGCTKVKVAWLSLSL
jgi:hypothetical protein